MSNHYANPPIIQYPIEPGNVVPNPNGGNGNPFYGIWILIIAVTIGLHISQGNIKPRINQTPTIQSTEYPEQPRP